MNEAPRNVLRPLLLLATLFFMWGFLTSMNDILIPHFKEVFELTQTRATLVQSAFFGAYFIGSVAYFAISVKWSDPIARIGYQRGAVLGLLLSGAGALLFLPASTLESYELFLSGLFVLGLGFTLLQISANPYVTVLGPERTASARLNLCQGFNSLGTTLGPLIGGALILKVVSSGEGGAAAVRGPYLVFAGMLLALALFMAVVRLPRIAPGGTIESGLGALRYPHLVRGIVAIFLYVGAEVSVGSILIDYLKQDEMGAMSKDKGSLFVSFYWGGLMIGRFLGAVLLGNARDRAKMLALVGIPVAGYFFMAFSTSQVRDDMAFGETLSLLAPYAALLVLNLLAFLLGASKAGRTTGIFALLAAALMVVPVVSGGSIALWAVVGLGLFNSIMWSNVFSLSIEGLGKHKSQASSLLVMAIVGGALLPQAQAGLADVKGFPISFVIPLVAYLYIAYFGFRGHRPSPTAS